MKHTNIPLSFFLVFVFALHTLPAFAIETDAEMESRIALLRDTHAELKAEVEAGALSKEDARAQWQKLIKEARAEKEAFFEKKRAQIEVRYETMLGNNPERAELFKEHIDAMRERHEARVEQRVELRAQIESGEITRQEANNIRVDFVQNQQQDFQELRADLKEKRAQFRDENQNTRRRGAYVEIEGIKGESTKRSAGGAFINIDDVKRETRANVRMNPTQTGRALEVKVNTDGTVTPLQFDPLGINALQAFPQIKADLQRATDSHTTRINRAISN